MSEASFTFYRETNFKTVELNGKKVRIPEEWEVVELGDFINILTGYAFKSKLFNTDRKGLPLPEYAT